MDRPNCQEKVGWEGKCDHPAKFVLSTPLNKGMLVCGIHARAYRADALHPFRMRDWLKRQEANNG